MPSDSSSTDAALYASRVAALVSEHGEVPAPWAYYPRVHPLDIHWRMGGGEDYAYLFQAWAHARAWQFDDRLAYVRRWHPPFSWLEWVASFLWPDEITEDAPEATEEHFERMERLGLGSYEDWSRCHEVEPEAYPLADDRSERWLR